CQQVGLCHSKARRIAGLSDGTMKFKMSKASHIVKIQRIVTKEGSRPVSLSPLRCLLQVKHWICVRKSGRKPASGQRKIKFCRAPFEVVASFCFGIIVVRRCSDEIGHAARLRKIKDMLGAEKTLVRIIRIRKMIDLKAEGEIGCEASGQVRADL